MQKKHNITPVVVLLVFSIICFSFGQVARISLFNQLINSYLYELSVFFIVLFLSISLGLKPITELFPRLKLVYYWFGYLFLSYLIGWWNYLLFQNFVGLLYLVRLSGYVLFYIYVYYYAHFLSDKIKRYLVYLVAGLVLAGALIQYFLYPDLRNLLYMGWDPHLYRLIGTFFEPPVAGAVFGLLFFAVLCEPKLFRAQILRLSLLVTCFSAVLLTYSRGIYLAFVLTLFIYFIQKKSYRFLLITLVAFVIGITVLPREFGEGVNLLRVFSIKSRAADTAEAIQTWQKSPLVGVGYNRIRFAWENTEDLQQYGYSHAGGTFTSSFTTMLAAGGVVGLLGLLALLYAVGSTSQFAAYAVLFVSIASLTDNLLLHGVVLYLLFLLTALVSRFHSES